MLYCKNCGKAVEDNSGICKQCGRPVPRLDGAEIHNTDEYFNEKKEKTKHYKDVSSDYNSNLVLFKVLSFIFPIVGLILFFCYKENEPTKAYACLRFAGFGFLTELLLSFILPLLITAIFGFSFFSFIF